MARFNESCTEYTDAEFVLTLGKGYLCGGHGSRLMSENLLNPTTEKTVRRPELGEGRRSLLQIRVDILRVVMEGYGKPTQIMYKANLSWNVLQSQLKAFLEAGLLGRRVWQQA